MRGLKPIQRPCTRPTRHPALARSVRRDALRGVCVALLLQPLACPADGAWNGSVALTSDYVYRGVSQTSGGAALQLGLDYLDHAGWFIGAWGSNVDPYPGYAASTELDLYAGLGGSVGDRFTWRGTYTHYQYVRDPRAANYSHNELAAALTYLDLVAASVSYQPDSSVYSDLGFARKRATLAYEMTGRLPLRAGFALTAGAGYYDLHDSFGVRYWAGDAGLSYSYRRLGLSLLHFSSDRTVARLYDGSSANGQWTFSAVLRFR